MLSIEKKKKCDLEICIGLIFLSLYQILSPKQSGHGESGVWSPRCYSLLSAHNVLVFQDLTNKIDSGYHCIHFTWRLLGIPN